MVILRLHLKLVVLSVGQSFNECEPDVLAFVVETDVALNVTELPSDFSHGKSVGEDWVSTVLVPFRPLESESGPAAVAQNFFKEHRRIRVSDYDCAIAFNRLHRVSVDVGCNHFGPNRVAPVETERLCHEGEHWDRAFQGCFDCGCGPVAVSELV